MNLDRFAQGPKDPQEEKPVTFCEFCGMEIYPGEEVYVLQDGRIYCTADCVIKEINAVLVPVEEALNVV